MLKKSYQSPVRRWMKQGAYFSFCWDDDLAGPVLTDVINRKLCKICKLLIQEYRSPRVIFVTSANNGFKESKSCLRKNCTVRCSPDVHIFVFNEFDMALLCCIHAAFMICLPHFSNILLFCSPPLFLQFNQTGLLADLLTCWVSFLYKVFAFSLFLPGAHPPDTWLANYPASSKPWLKSHLVNKAHPDYPL